MLLRRLVDYSDRLESRPTLYSEVPVRYIVELDGSGNLLSPEITDTSDPKSSHAKRGEFQLMPQIQRSKGIKPIIFASNSEYTFGLARDSKKAERVVECHHAYVEMLRRCADRTELFEVRAVSEFLDSEPISRLMISRDFDRGARVTFRVNGVFPADLPAVQRFWADEHHSGNTDGSESRTMQCVVCSEIRPVVARLQAKVKGIPSGHRSGTALISANAEAFESYGLRASMVAPTCAPCGERFTRAANDLLQKESNHMVIFGTAFIFWTVEPSEISFHDLFLNPRLKQARAIAESMRSSPNSAELRDNPLYAAALSANGGRTVVRDWIDTTITEVRGYIVRWFEHQTIVGPRGEEPRLFAITALAGATVRELRDLRPRVLCALFRAALTGTPVPLDIMYGALRRGRAEQKITNARAALIKLVLRSRLESSGEDLLVRLDESNHNPPYLCGRLLALLELSQRPADAGMGPNATIVGRFYSTALSAPRSVFSRLLRGGQIQPAKLKHDRRDTYHAIQLRLEEIIAQMGAFPQTLALDEQALFSLGYYHQRAHDRAQAAEARADPAASTEGDNDGETNKTTPNAANEMNRR
jgi:CRISPR-associated protein Csd1